MKRTSLVKEAHSVIMEHLHRGDIAIDATVGNGNDTLFLAEQVGPAGKIYGFDIQPLALASTRAKLTQHDLNHRVVLIEDSHARLAENVPEPYHGMIKAIMFNLGYLPGSDKAIITQTESTLAALDAALKILAPGGLVTIMAYPGHTGGDHETESVHTWCGNLENSRFSVRIIYGAEHKNSSPRLFVIEKV
ncbi:MAG: class I SAM-dependent methyltransferase [Gammaproteobacteria bacterium]